MEPKLQSLIAAGAAFTPHGRPSQTAPLAAAHILTTGELWICHLWPDNEFAQHWRSFGAIEDRGHELVFKHANGDPLYSIAELDPDERDQWQWTRWTSADDVETRTFRDFVKSLELGISNTIAA